MGGEAFEIGVCCTGELSAPPRLSQPVECGQRWFIVHQIAATGRSVTIPLPNDRRGRCPQHGGTVKIDHRRDQPIEVSCKLHQAFQRTLNPLKNPIRCHTLFSSDAAHRQQWRRWIDTEIDHQFLPGMDEHDASRAQGSLTHRGRLIESAGVVDGGTI